MSERSKLKQELKDVYTQLNSYISSKQCAYNELNGLKTQKQELQRIIDDQLYSKRCHESNITQYKRIMQTCQNKIDELLAKKHKERNIPQSEKDALNELINNTFKEKNNARTELYNYIGYRKFNINQIKILFEDKKKIMAQMHNVMCTITEFKNNVEYYKSRRNELKEKLKRTPKTTHYTYNYIDDSSDDDKYYNNDDDDRLIDDPWGNGVYDDRFDED